MPGPSFPHCWFDEHCLFAAVKNDASRLSHHAVTAQWHNPNYTAASSDAPLLSTLPLTCNNVIKYGKFIVREIGHGIHERKPYGGSGNTYADGTAINAGTVAITKDRALGAATGALVFTGRPCIYRRQFAF